jgi:pimeloyl-ACP methyl ester carboxylesterase
MTSGPRSPLTAAGVAAASLAGTALASAALASAAFQEAAAALDRRRFPPPGRLVDIGGRRLHLLEAGTGRPPVVVVAALADSVPIWVSLQRELAPDIRLCLYDRAGAGWSDPPPRGPRTPEASAADLRALLDAAPIETPCVLVGHSVGGVIARRFAAQYPEAVAGLILVDSSHENQAARRGQDGWRGGRADYYRRVLTWQLRPLGLYRLAAAAGLARRLDADVESEVPAEFGPAYRAILLSSRERQTVVGELLMMARLTTPPPRLGSLPLTVITAETQLPGWQQMQNELAALSTRSTQITAAGCGHYVHADDPKLVAQAIRDMVATVEAG